MLTALAATLGLYAATDTMAVRQAMLRPATERVTGPLVSAVIPAFNEEKYLPFLLDSLERQNYSPIEVIVVDSGIDDTSAIAQQWGARVLNTPWGNISLARNVGARASGGDYLFFLDADCILPANTVAELVGEVLKPGTALAWGRSMPVDSIGHSLAWSIAALMIPRTWTTGRGIMVRKSAFWEVGGYNELVNPLEGGREDKRLGADIAARFGDDAIRFRRDVIIGTTMRRERAEGYFDKTFGGAPVWKTPAVRRRRV